MKGDQAFLPVATAVAISILVGCGGAAQVTLENDAGGDSGTPPPLGGSDAASPPISPGMIGTIIGGMGPDGGAAPIADSGSTAMPSTRQVVDGCNQLCAKENAAACSGSGTVDSCLIGCRVILASPSCATAAQSLFSCLTTATASCDSAGNVVFNQCQGEQLAVDGCFVQNVVDPGLATPCSTYCAHVTAANCPNDTAAGCQTGCQVLGNLIAGCGPPWKNYVACSNGAALTCAANGKASSTACTSQGLAFFACAAGGLATILSDGGR
jgi:hypothetical protein